MGGDATRKAGLQTSMWPAKGVRVGPGKWAGDTEGRGHAERNPKPHP